MSDTNGVQEWSRLRLGDVIHRHNEIIHPGDRSDGEAQFVGLEHIESNTGRRTGSIEISLGNLTGRKPTFKKGQIIYGYLRPYLNKVWIAEFDGCSSVDQFAFDVRDMADPTFVAAYMRSDVFLRRSSVVTTTGQLPRISIDEILAVEIDLPPLSEQKRIAGILKEQLAAVERARAAAEVQLETAQALPAAYLRYVFENADADNWPKHQLGDACHIQLGKMLSPKSKTGERPIPYLRNANVQWNRFDLGEMAEMDFSKAQEENFALRPGDLLVCEGGEPGRAAVWNGELERCCYQKALHRLRSATDGAVDMHFVMYRLWYGAGIGEFTDSHAQTTIAHLPAVRLRKLLIGLPHTTMQQKLAKSLNQRMSATDETISRCKSHISTIDTLPAALLRAAFQGRL